MKGRLLLFRARHGQNLVLDLVGKKQLENPTGWPAPSKIQTHQKSTLARKPTTTAVSTRSTAGLRICRSGVRCSPGVTATIT